MEHNKKHILIATPIYPPDIGGPAQYAVMLRDGFEKSGHTVSVVSYGTLMRLPTGVRHLAYLCKLVPHAFSADTIVVLDTFSAAVPAIMLAKLLRKKTIVRVGGDFLWESYVERTHEPVLLSEFYTNSSQRQLLYTQKEKKIFDLTMYVFRHATHIVFSTVWQRDIMMKPYDIVSSKVRVIENLYPARAKRNLVPKKKLILSPSRDIFLKNTHGLEAAFEILKQRFIDIYIDTATSSREVLLDRMSLAYCLVVPSLSEVSPNIVIDAVTMGVPVVVTEDCGIKDRLSDTVVWVDPRKPESIADGIALILDAQKYAEYMTKLSKFDVTHTADEIVQEFEELFDK